VACVICGWLRQIDLRKSFDLRNGKPGYGSCEFQLRLSQTLVDN
jgi:hypothetical protein